MSPNSLASIGLLGCTGRMGQRVERLIREEFSNRAQLTAQVSEGRPLERLFDTDVVIDFSSPDAVIKLESLSRSVLPLPDLVVGSTGWTDEGKKILDSLSKRTRVLVSANFSVGVHLLRRLLRDSAPLFLSAGYTPVLTETHHRHKKDAPSGTALALIQEIQKIDPAPIQTHSIRAGEVIGDHEVSFLGVADRITLSHHAQDRSLFARGAIEVALWLAHTRNKSSPAKGLLGMDDYFNERLSKK